MIIRFYIIFLFFAGIFFFYSCTKDDFDEPNGVKIAFQAMSVLKSSADTVMIKEAFIGIEEIDFKLEKTPDTVGLEKIVNEGPYVVDLLNRTITPAIRWVFVEPGKYRKIEIKTSNVLKGGNSLVIKGTFMPADRSGDIPFEIVSAAEHNLIIENTDGIDIMGGNNLNLLIYFDLSNLFSGINLKSVNRNPDGLLVISDDFNRQIINLLIDRIEQYSSFRKDDGLNWDIPGEIDVNDEVDDSGEIDDESPGTGNPEPETDVGGSEEGPGSGTNDEPTDDGQNDNSDDSDDDIEEDDGQNEEGQDDDSDDEEPVGDGSQDETGDNSGDDEDKGDGEEDDNNSSGPGKGNGNKGDRGDSGEGNNGNGKGNGGSSDNGNKGNGGK